MAERIYSWTIFILLCGFGYSCVYFKFIFIFVRKDSTSWFVINAIHPLVFTFHCLFVIMEMPLWVKNKLSGIMYFLPLSLEKKAIKNFKLYSRWHVYPELCNTKILKLCPLWHVYLKLTLNSCNAHSLHQDFNTWSFSQNDVVFTSLNHVSATSTPFLKMLIDRTLTKCECVAQVQVWDFWCKIFL